MGPLLTGQLLNKMKVLKTHHASEALPPNLIKSENSEKRHASEALSTNLYIWGRG
jgi:hypothetical protein